MKVYNIIITSNKEKFLDTLIRYLIKNEVDFVNVENFEFHMLDNIYRFYSQEDIIDKNIEVLTEINLQENLENKIVELRLNNLENFYNKDLEFIEVGKPFQQKNENTYTKQNKKSLRENNIMTNKRIKTLTKQYNCNRRISK